MKIIQSNATFLTLQKIRIELKKKLVNIKIDTFILDDIKCINNIQRAFNLFRNFDIACEIYNQHTHSTNRVKNFEKLHRLSILNASKNIVFDIINYATSNIKTDTRELIYSLQNYTKIVKNVDDLNDFCNYLQDANCDDKCFNVNKFIIPHIDLTR